MSTQSTQCEYAPVLYAERPYDRVKRVIDILIAGGALLTLAPLAIVLAVAIRLDDPGPVHFRQRRVGRNGRIFTMLKFRTMRVETPDISTEEMKKRGQSYHTRLGKILRKTSLDELPQLWNILAGEMSIVGPRPALHNQDRLIALRAANGVHAVRPGITGLAQVLGRDDLDDHTKVAHDREYVARRSLWLDVSIVWRTFSTVLTSRGNF